VQSAAALRPYLAGLRHESVQDARAGSRREGETRLRPPTVYAALYLYERAGSRPNFPIPCSYPRSSAFISGPYLFSESSRWAGGKAYLAADERR